ncbi:hypothetical protein QZH56_22660 [Streptomyces olivoreticuli]|uniref:WXG100 family type VII secretion target n=1 Tax=Streptomyces olivoreticuli TaxID=68246 RepID=UPI00265A9663|nr:hypothetical protein [Streptomyces olivoreticuli]WKK21644.1 hypothetical protein QZH56_22660 [Streptomyces olivoreticuli]
MTVPDVPLTNSPLANPADPRRQFPSPFATYDFTSVPHEQLQAMVEPADAQKVTDLAHRLTEASTAIKELGDDLKKHMDRVHWQGEGGDAFRGWGSRMSNATLRLGHYAENAGTWMNHAAVTLGQVKRDMPKYSAASKATVDSYLNAQPPNMRVIQEPLVDLPAVGPAPSQRQAYEAQKRLHDDHMHAAELLKKLSESYNASGVQLMRAERPRFPPAPDRVLPPTPNREGKEHVSLPGGSDAPRSAGPSASSVTGLAAATGGTTMGSATAYSSSGHVVRPGGSHAVDLDGGVVAPHVPSPAPYREGTATSRPDGSADRAHPQLPSVPLPVPGRDRQGPGSGDGRVPTLPGTRQPTVPGRDSLPGRPSVSAPGVPRDGIVGGRLVPRIPPSPTGNPPRGVVIGTEPGQGRTPVGPGGVVGGRPPMPRPGGAAMDRPFTPGGSGLVGNRPTGAGSPAAQSGMRGGGMAGMPATSLGSAPPGRRQGSRRPDYLVEDEETWSQGNKRVVPPVID